MTDGICQRDGLRGPIQRHQHVIGVGHRRSFRRTVARKVVDIADLSPPTWCGSNAAISVRVPTIGTPRTAVRLEQEVTMLAKRVATGYAVGPGQGVPHRGRDVKASGQSTGGTLTVIEITIDG